MSRAHIFAASGGLAYLDAAGARWFAGQWEALIFAGLGILSLALCYGAALYRQRQ